MGSILASAILTKASFALNDVAQVRWTAPELLGYLNDGQRAAAVIKPSCSAKTVDFTLAAGLTKQSIPADTIGLVDPVRNLGADGLTPGLPITFTDRDSLDSVHPTWHTDTNTAGSIAHLVPSKDPRTFYVYPMAPATAWHIECVFAANPVDCATTASAIDLDDNYEPALLDYVLYRAFMKDSTVEATAMRAAAYYKSFSEAIGGRALAPQV